MHGVRSQTNLSSRADSPVHLQPNIIHIFYTACSMCVFFSCKCKVLLTCQCDDMREQHKTIYKVIEGVSAQNPVFRKCTNSKHCTAFLILPAVFLIWCTWTQAVLHVLIKYAADSGTTRSWGCSQVSWVVVLFRTFSDLLAFFTVINICILPAWFRWHP